MTELYINGSKVNVDIPRIIVKDFKEKLGLTDEQIYKGFMNFSKTNDDYINGR